MFLSRTKQHEQARAMSKPSALESSAEERKLAPNTTARGIMNIGNTCYMASSLQMLINDEAFVQGIRESLEKADNDSDKRVTSAFICMADQLNEGEVADPSNFKKELAKHNSQFSTGEQQDAQEMLLSVFNAFEAELRGAREICPIKKSFEIVQGNTFQCTKCGLMTQSPQEVERMISLAMPIVNEKNKGRCDLTSLLKAYFAEELVEKQCENCFNSNQAARKTRLFAAPRVLLLHLKRFRITGTNYSNFRKEKVLDPVFLPEKISLDKFFPANDGQEYKLQGVVRHRSSSANYGHYVADVLLPSGQWLCFNDSNVRELGDCMDGTSRREKEGYILYYVKNEVKKKYPCTLQ